MLIKFHNAFLGFFATLATKTEGSHIKYFEKPYVSVCGTKIIERPINAENAQIIFNGQKYCHFIPLENAITKIRRSAPSPSNLELKNNDSAKAKLEKLGLL